MNRRERPGRQAGRLAGSKRLTITQNCLLAWWDQNTAAAIPENESFKHNETLSNCTIHVFYEFSSADQYIFLAMEERALVCLASNLRKCASVQLLCNARSPALPVSVRERGGNFP
jgi:hypothetical protein